jgi:parvulin-like peptidyl-prolyl isomerase
VRQAIGGFLKMQPFPVAMFFAARIVAVAALAAMLCACTREPPRQSDAEIVVAEVDNASIVLREVKNEILSLRGYSPSLEARRASRSEASEALRRLVEREIVLQEGARRGVTVSFSSLEEEAMRYRKDFPPGGLEKALLQVGMSPDGWREQLRRSLLYRKSADAIASSLVSVAPGEVEEAFRKEGKPAEMPERIRVRQFLFDSASLASGAREKLLDGSGVNVEGDAAAGGVDLGFFSREELPAELPQELFLLKEGEVGDPVPLEGTFSLFQVTQREPARARTLESEEARIRNSLLSVRREEALRQWLAQASAKATVKVRAELLENLVEGKP